VQSFGSVGSGPGYAVHCRFVDQRNQVDPAEACRATTAYPVLRPGRDGKPSKTVMRKVVSNSRARAIARNQYAGENNWSA
jgi:hypothetical protein